MERQGGQNHPYLLSNETLELRDYLASSQRIKVKREEKKNVDPVQTTEGSKNVQPGI